MLLLFLLVAAGRSKQAPPARLVSRFQATIHGEKRQVMMQHVNAATTCKTGMAVAPTSKTSEPDDPRVETDLNCPFTARPALIVNCCMEQPTAIFLSTVSPTLLTKQHYLKFFLEDRICT